MSRQVIAGDLVQASDARTDALRRMGHDLRAEIQAETLLLEVGDGSEAAFRVVQDRLAILRKMLARVETKLESRRAA